MWEIWNSGIEDFEVESVRKAGIRNASRPSIFSKSWLLQCFCTYGVDGAQLLKRPVMKKPRKNRTTLAKMMFPLKGYDFQEVLGEYLSHQNGCINSRSLFCTHVVVQTAIGIQIW